MNKVLKSKKVFLFIILAVTQFSFGQTLLTYDNFNQGFGNWNDPGDNCLRLDSWWSSCLNGDDYDSGTFSVRLRKNTSSSRLISDQYDFSSYSQVKITYNFSTSSAPESGEGWFIEYSDDNGSSWVTVKQYINGVNFTENQCVSNEEVLIEPSSTINFNSSQILLRFRNNMNRNDEQLWLDNIKVEGFASTSENLFFEDFEDEDEDDTNGEDINNIPWDTDLNGTNPDRFEVRNGNYFEAEDTDGTPYWYTNAIDISDYEDLNFSLDIVDTDKLDDTDFIRFSYKLNGGDLITIATIFNDVSGSEDWDLVDNSGNPITGNTLEIYIEFNSNKNDEYHRIDNIKLTGTINCDAVDNNVTGASATADDSQATLSWSNPNASCVTIDEVLVVAKQGSAVTTSPSGDGSAYTASATFGSLGSAFDGGFVVYKGGAETVTITGLVNFVTYHATLFTRSGTNWSSGETVLITPSVSEDLFYEDFQDEVQGDQSGIDDVNQISWYTNQNNSNPDEFAVDEDGSVHHFEADGTNNLEADWYTDPINISGYDNLKLSLYVREDASGGDIIKLRYSLNNGTTKILVNSSSTISGGTGNNQAYEFSFTDDLTAEDNLQIYITFVTNSDQFKIDDVKLTGSPFYNVWQGAQSDLVTTNSNWSKGSVPTATSNVLVPNGKHLKLVDDRAFNAINIEPTANLTIEKTGSLTTIGDFTKIAGTGAVTLNSEATEFASIIVEGTATGEITYNKYINYLAYQEWDLVGSPVLNQNMQSFAQTHTNSNNTGPLAFDDPYYALGQYLTEWGSYSNYTTSTIPNSSFPAGKGYQMATNPTGSGNDMEGQTLAFTGDIATTSQSIDVQNLNGTNNGYGRRWNLVANPFPSYISAQAFFATNSSIMGGAYNYCYVWRTGDETDNSTGNGKWGIYNLLQNNSGPGDFQIAPGQAFFVAAASADVAQIRFTPEMRTVEGGDDFINGAPMLLNYKLDLKLYNGSVERAKTKFHFQQGLTLGLDPAYDAAAYDQATALSSRLPEDDQGTNFHLSAMNIEAAYNQTIPLVINQQEGQSFRISISNNTLPEDINVYLEDALNGTLTSLKNQDFELSAQEDLSQDGRFYIRFTTESLAINDVPSPSSITIFKLNTDNFITIKGLSPDMGKTSAALYNMLGMKVAAKALNSNTSTQTISTQGLASGVYIISLTAGEQAISKKVIIQ